MTKVDIRTCSAGSNGGGASVRGEASLILENEVTIRECKATRGKGGGLLAAGEKVIVKGDKVDPECFHFFCEKNTLADFVALICQRTIDRLIKVEAQLTDPLAR